MDKFKFGDKVRLRKSLDPLDSSFYRGLPFVLTVEMVSSSEFAMRFIDIQGSYATEDFELVPSEQPKVDYVVGDYVEAVSEKFTQSKPLLRVFKVIEFGSGYTRLDGLTGIYKSDLFRKVTPPQPKVVEYNYCEGDYVEPIPEAVEHNTLPIGVRKVLSVIGTLEKTRVVVDGIVGSWPAQCFRKVSRRMELFG